MKYNLLLATALLLLPTWIVRGEDWPQWYGANRDGVIRETNLVREIPKDGLKVLWRHPIAGGYSGPSIASGKVIVSD